MSGLLATRGINVGNTLPENEQNERQGGHQDRVEQIPTPQVSSTITWDPMKGTRSKTPQNLHQQYQVPAGCHHEMEGRCQAEPNGHVLSRPNGQYGNHHAKEAGALQNGD